MSTKMDTTIAVGSRVRMTDGGTMLGTVVSVGTTNCSDWSRCKGSVGFAMVRWDSGFTGRQFFVRLVLA